VTGKSLTARGQHDYHAGASRCFDETSQPNQSSSENSGLSGSGEGYGLHRKDENLSGDYGVNFLLTFSILGILLMLHALFSATETALFSLTKIEKRRLNENHPRLASWVMNHLEHPSRTLTAIIIGNLIVNILATAMVTLLALEAWGPRGAGIAIVIFTVVLVLFGEIVPKTSAVKHNEFFALVIGFPLRCFSILIAPIIYVTQVITDRILSSIVFDKKELPEDISEEELKTLVKIGEEEGVLDRQERYMIHKLFELGERPVKDIMTPRVDMAALDLEDSPEKHVEIIKKFHFTHFPVYKESVDNILGVIPVQKYLLSKKRNLESFLEEPLFVPEVKKIDDLLKEFRETNKSFAICVDEFGGTDGVVTLEDVLEEIFGEFYDEYAKVENPIRPHGHREYIVEAKISLADFNEYFSSELEAEEGISTLSGYILERLGEVPEKGKLIKTDEFEMRIHEVIRHRRIRSVIVRPLK